MAFGEPSVIKSERIKINEPNQGTNKVTIEKPNLLEEFKKQSKLVQEFNYKEDESNQVANEIIIDKPNKTEETSIYYQQSIEPQSKKEETQRMVIEAQQRIVEERIERLEEQKKHIQNLEDQMKNLKNSYKNSCIFSICIGVPALIGILYVFNNFLKDNLVTLISNTSFLYIGVIEVIVITIFMITLSYALQKIHDNHKEILEKEIQATEEKVQTLKKDLWIF